MVNRRAALRILVLLSFLLPAAALAARAAMIAGALRGPAGEPIAGIEVQLFTPER